TWTRLVVDSRAGPSLNRCTAASSPPCGRDSTMRTFHLPVFQVPAHSLFSSSFHLHLACLSSRKRRAGSLFLLPRPLFSRAVIAAQVPFPGRNHPVSTPSLADSLSSPPPRLLDLV